MSTTTTVPAKASKAKLSGAEKIAKAASAPRVAPIIGTISSAVAMPERTNRNGKAVYPFDALSVGQSFSVVNKTAKQLASVVSAANRRARVNKVENGILVLNDKNEPVKVAGKHFFARDTDPKTDPDGASVRVWRSL